MTLRKYLLWLLLLLPQLVIAQNKISIELETPEVIVAGERFKVSVVLSNADGKVSMPTPEGVELLFGPSTTRSVQTTFINGDLKTFSTTTFSYTFLAEKAGTYTIPEAVVTINNSTYKTKPKSIQVFTPEAVYGADNSNGNNSAGNKQAKASQEQRGMTDKDIFIVAHPSKTTVYEQEGVLVTFRIYTTNTELAMTNADFPEFENFVSQELSTTNKQWKAESVNGRLYFYADFYQVYITPQKAGMLTIPSGSFDFNINIKNNDLQDDFFDNFFGQYQTIRKRLHSKPLTISAKPLPNNKPKGFTGAVGEFSLTAELPKKELKANESLQYTLRLTGKGNIKLVSVPSPQFPEGFDVYDPKTEENITVLASGATGEKSTTYYAVPRYPGEYTLPEIHFSYFDPSVGKYKTEVIPATQLHVEKGRDNQTNMNPTYGTREDIKYLNKDIRYLKPSNGRSFKERLNPITFVLGYVVIALLAVIVFFVYRKRTSNGKECAEHRAKRAGTIARKYLKLADKKKAEGEEMAYYEALLKGLNNYISAKFHIPLAELSKEKIKAVMNNAGMSLEVITTTLEALGTLELARYTPVTEDLSVLKEKLYTQAAHVIESIEATKYKHKK